MGTDESRIAARGIRARAALSPIHEQKGTPSPPCRLQIWLAWSHCDHRHLAATGEAAAAKRKVSPTGSTQPPRLRYVSFCEFFCAIWFMRVKKETSD
jgi:hypothetical protein